MSKKQKPTRDFPLFLHASGQWAKKLAGKLHYFGTDPDAALEKYLDEKDDRRAGRVPRSQRNDIRLRALVNSFLTAKRRLVDAGELSLRTWSDYYTTCETLIAVLGKDRSVPDIGADDFARLREKLAKTRGPVALGNAIQRIRTVLKFAFEERLIEKPIPFGSTFKKPNRRTMRQARYSAGPRLIDAADLRKIIAAAGIQIRAMILLGINCGFGNADCASLPLSALDLDSGLVNFPRPKTALPRRCPLWPETVAAIQAAIEARPDHRKDEDAGLVFITKYGKRWVRLNAKKNDDDTEAAGVISDAVRLEFGKLLEELELKRRGLGFYALRHTFRTIADGSKDQPAIDHIMGHARDDMASVYRERIDDDRLTAVTDHVRTWLFGEGKP